MPLYLFFIIPGFLSIHLLSDLMTKTYEVKSITKGALNINGKGDNSIWNQANVLSDFQYPWNEGTPPTMTFQALHDRDYLYGLYRVVDPKKILIYQLNNSKREILSSDRVEIFFRKNEKMDPYYGLELDAAGRIYDQEAYYHRKFNADWTWPAGELKVKAEVNSTGYTLEFAISKKSLIKLGLLKDNTIEAGLYRGECIELEGNQAEFKWISWVKPDSQTPDFHIPSSFGMLILEK
ncbi:MAG: sugar-binding protein [Saprospiraceae bacterium]